LAHYIVDIKISTWHVETVFGYYKMQRTSEKPATDGEGMEVEAFNTTEERRTVYRRRSTGESESGRGPLHRKWHLAVAMGAILLLALSLSPLSIGATVFSTPVQISSATGSNHQYKPQIAVDSSGDSHLTWEGNDGTVQQIYYADNTSGSWSAPVQITSAAVDDDQKNPQIAVDSSGDSHLTWYGYNPTTNAYQIWYVDNTSGSWPVPTQITSANVGNDQKSPQIAMDLSGDSHLTWYGYHPTTGAPYQIWYADNTSGSWVTTPITGAGSDQVDPQIALDSDDNSHLTWYGDDGTAQQIYYADNTSGWSTTPITTIVVPGDDQRSPQIALDLDDNSHLTWYGDDGTAQQIYYADNTTGSWPAPTPITTAGGGNFQVDPRIAVDSGGDSHLTWDGKHPTSGGDEQVWYADNTSGSWSTTQPAPITAINYQVEPRIALDSGDNSHLTWRGTHPTTGLPSQIWYSSDIEPTVTGLNPATGTNDQSALPVTVHGADFQNGATLALTGPDTVGPVTTTGSGNTLNATLDLTGKSAGTYRATVTNPGLTSGSKDNAFTVEYPAPKVTSITPNSADNDGTVNITNLKGTNFRNGATVQLIGPSGSGESGAGTINATNVNVASSTKITCKFNLAGAAAGSYKVKIENTDGKSGEKANVFTVNSAASTWYLAEGSTDWGYDCYITIENPNNESVSATITYMTDAGAVPGGDIDLPANSQATIDVFAVLGAKDFSTKVECKEGKTIAVDRTMSWTGEGAPSPDGHCSIGVTSADTTWYLAEGSSAWGFECWLLIQNPNPAEATAQVTYMIEGADPVTVEKKIPAQSRRTYNMANDIGAKDASIKVTADMPVIPERAMYKNNKRSGHDSIGTTAAAANYYLAEGTTDWGFTTYVLVQNPNPTETNITVTYMTSSGPVPDPNNPVTMPANSRKTICVNDVLPDTDFSTHVNGSQPIIAERAMYWGEGTALGEAAHDSIGLAAPHTTFYLPDGQTSEGRETYTLVMNPNATEVTVEVSYLTPDGAGNVVFTETVGANSRKTFSMADKGINGRAAVMVECKTAGKKIMVERAMYWNSRGAGTDTIGGYGD